MAASFSFFPHLFLFFKSVYTFSNILPGHKDWREEKESIFNLQILIQAKESDVVRRWVHQRNLKRERNKNINGSMRENKKDQDFRVLLGFLLHCLFRSLNSYKKAYNYIEFINRWHAILMPPERVIPYHTHATW